MSLFGPDLSDPTFPPLLRGEGLKAGLDPLAKAVAAGLAGADPGLVVWSRDQATARAALLLAPELPLERAMGALFAVQIGLADALGALAPPEVAVHFVWPDRLKVNGARCGRFRAAASTKEPTAEPDWLAVAFDVPVLPGQGPDPGETPDRTVLALEGCAEITAPRLIESWSRHALVWLNRFEDEGLAPLHASWRSRCDDLGERVGYPEAGLFLGLDESGGMLLKTASGTRAVPLTSVLGG